MKDPAEMPTRELLHHLAWLDADDLAAFREQEKAGANRAVILRRIDALTVALSPEGEARSQAPVNAEQAERAATRARKRAVAARADVRAGTQDAAEATAARKAAEAATRRAAPKDKAAARRAAVSAREAEASAAAEAAAARAAARSAGAAAAKKAALAKEAAVTAQRVAMVSASRAAAAEARRHQRPTQAALEESQAHVEWWADDEARVGPGTVVRCHQALMGLAIQLGGRSLHRATVGDVEEWLNRESCAAGLRSFDGWATTSTRGAVAAYLKQRQPGGGNRQAEDQIRGVLLSSFTAACPSNPSEIERVHVLRWLDAIGGLSIVRRAECCEIARRFTAWLVSRGALRVDPFTDVETPTSPEEPVTPASAGHLSFMRW